MIFTAALDFVLCLFLIKVGFDPGLSGKNPRGKAQNEAVTVTIPDTAAATGHGLQRHRLDTWLCEGADPTQQCPQKSSGTPWKIHTPLESPASLKEHCCTLSMPVRAEIR